MNCSCRVYRGPGAIPAFALLGAAPAKHEQLAALATEGNLPMGPMAYLITAAGHTFRSLGMVPVTDAGGKKVAAMISYEGDTREPAAAASAAAELMDALGPQLQTAGETDVVVQARVLSHPLI